MSAKKNNIIDLDNLLTKQEVADKLKVSVKTVERMLDGGLPSFVFRNKRYIQREDLQNYVQSEKGA